MLAVLLLLVALTSSNEFGRKEGAVIELQDDSAPIASRCPKGADAAEEGTVASCLANRGAQCDAEARSCAAGLYPRACMFAKIPVGTPFSRIQCCFACCLKVWMGRFGLLDNDQYWSAARGGTKNTNGPVDAVHGATSSTTLSSIVYNYHRGKTGWRRGGKECVHGNCTVPHGGIVTVNKAICGRGDRQYHQCNLEYFAKQRVPHMGGAPFVLVTTTDLKLPSSAPSGQSLVDNPRLLSWFVSNRDEGAPKQVIALPRAILPSSDVMHAAMASIEQHALPKRRQIMCFNLKFRPGDGRAEAIEALERNGFNCTRSAGRLAFGDFFREMHASQFVLSPWGHGVNNHREWEALAAGSIPVMQRYAPNADMYKDLPVVFVDNWETVTPAFLDGEWNRIAKLNAAKCTSLSRAYLPYWLGRLTQFMQPGEG